MVLTDLGAKLIAVVESFNGSSNGDVNEAEVKELLSGACKALIRSDVPVKEVQAIRNVIMKKIEAQVLNQPRHSRAGAAGRKRMCVQILGDGLQNLFGGDKVTPEQSSAVFQKLHSHIAPCGRSYLEGRLPETIVVMMVGLQGAGKTTTIVKAAAHFRKRGMDPAVVCADTFRAGAYEQLEQGCAKTGIPFYGDRQEASPILIAKDGVKHFKAQRHDLILVDTSGRHQQEQGLLEEMKMIRDEISPDLVYYVMDSHIGQAARAQAEGFASVIDIGAIILTKMDGHAKGGGAIAAVQATGAPVVFVGNGEKATDLETFDVKGYVSELLGGLNYAHMAEGLSTVMNSRGGQQTMDNLSKGKYSFLDMREQYKMMQQMNIGAMMKSIPMLREMTNQGVDLDEGQHQFKRMTDVVNSMTTAEKTCAVELDEKRIARIARGSGRDIVQVQEVMQIRKMLEGMVSGMKDLFNPNSTMANDMMKSMAGMMGGNSDLSKIFKHGGHTESCGMDIFKGMF